MNYKANLSIYFLKQENNKSLVKLSVYKAFILIMNDE